MILTYWARLIKDMVPLEAMEIVIDTASMIMTCWVLLNMDMDTVKVMAVTVIMA